jgi:DNA-binding NtrC family response regulator
MSDEALALLVHDRAEPCESLGALLRDLKVATWSIPSAEDMRDLLARQKPGLIFVDLPVWSRSGSSIISLAWSVDPVPNVVVVGSKPDIELYVSTIERGAFSYIAPPFSCEGLKLTISSALADVSARAEALARRYLTGPGSSQSITPNPGLKTESQTEYQVVSMLAR